MIIIPAFSTTHLEFALNAPNYQDFAAHPLIGWISGILLSDLGKATPKVFDGTKAAALENGAVVVHATLPAGRFATPGLVNIFEQGDGDYLEFTESSFSIADVLVDGNKMNFADYLTRNKIDTRLPLIADYFGVKINVSFQSVDVTGRTVNLYAPVFKGLKYKIAKPVTDYVSAFMSQLPPAADNDVLFSCNCILNYLHSQLEGKKTGEYTGPVTFGEIMYQLLNQTMVYLTISK
jgi:hypothetical protein